MIGYWMYTLLWFAVAMFIFQAWNASAVEKLLVMLLWMTLVPAGGQFETYGAYLRWYYTHNTQTSSDAKGARVSTEE